MNPYHNILFLLALSILGATELLAQEFKADIQLRPRYEYRNGYKELMKDGAYPNSLISQRSRLNLNFAQEKLKVKFSLQNIRTWGDVPTSSVSDKNGIAVYESWASYNFAEKWSAKIGRQVLAYDNQRILGGIDWAQQGQSHDALVIRYKDEKQQLDFVAALNANDALYDSPYAINYKNMQMLWYHKDFNQIKWSLLALNNGFQYQNLDKNKLSVANQQTLGTYLKWNSSSWNADFSAYFQTGETALGQDKAKVSAYYASLNIGHQINEQFKIEIGTEYLSGTDQNDTSGKIKSFHPLFGTNHIFNGFMDYFYVGNHKNSVGLHDLYGKLNFAKNQWQFTLSPHVFSSAANMYQPVNSEKLDAFLGTEIDLMISYKFTDYILLNGGYSQMFATDSMEHLKGGNKSYDNNWAWVMISINPEIFKL